MPVHWFIAALATASAGLCIGRLNWALFDSTRALAESRFGLRDSASIDTQDIPRGPRPALSVAE